MAFVEKEKKRPVHVSLNSTGQVIKEDLKGAASVAGGALKDAGKNVFGHAKGMTRFANSDLKHRMQNKSGRALDE